MCAFWVCDTNDTSLLPKQKTKNKNNNNKKHEGQAWPGHERGMGLQLVTLRHHTHALKAPEITPRSLVRCCSFLAE
jgi:hypothetical protein